jgi:hypothetical protein
MLQKGVEGLVPFGSLVRISIDELIDVEVLEGVNLVLTHRAIFPPRGYKREIGACEIDQRYRRRGVAD